MRLKTGRFNQSSASGVRAKVNGLHTEIGIRAYKLFQIVNFLHEDYAVLALKR